MIMWIEEGKKLKLDQKRWDERFKGKGFAFGKELKEDLVPGNGN